jgi:hypothetical protein
LGFQATDLIVKGSGKVNDESFSFTSEITKLRVAAEMIPETSEDILQYNPKAVAPTTKDLELELGAMKFENFPDGHADSAYIKEQLAKNVYDSIFETYNDIWDGDLDRMADLPVESFVPMMFGKHVGSFAAQFDINPDFVTYGFDPEPAMAGFRPESMQKRRQKLLKEINSEFSETDVEDQKRAIQVIFDENLINMFILDFVLVDKSFSLRDVMSMKQEMMPYINMMTTSNVGMLLPEVLEEFGENKKVDMMFTTSHALISAKLPDVKTSGFQMDKNGNFRFVINLGIEIAVEKGFGQYE